LEWGSFRKYNEKAVKKDIASSILGHKRKRGIIMRGLLWRIQTAWWEREEYLTLIWVKPRDNIGGSPSQERDLEACAPSRTLNSSFSISTLALDLRLRVIEKLNSMNQNTWKRRQLRPALATRSRGVNESTALADSLPSPPLLGI